MKTINTANTAVIAKAAAEAGIRADEKHTVNIVSCEGSLIGFEIETEWNRSSCYADMETGEIMGLMTEVKSLDELMAEARTSSSIRPRTGSASSKAA